MILILFQGQLTTYNLKMLSSAIAVQRVLSTSRANALS